MLIDNILHLTKYFLVRTFVVHRQAVKRSQEPFLFVHVFASSIFDLVWLRRPSPRLQRHHVILFFLFASVCAKRPICDFGPYSLKTFPDNPVKRFVNYMPITGTRGAENRYVPIIGILRYLLRVWC